jgi:hypothetical protein
MLIEAPMSDNNNNNIENYYNKIFIIIINYKTKKIIYKV